MKLKSFMILFLVFMLFVACSEKPRSMQDQQTKPIMLLPADRAKKIQTQKSEESKPAQVNVAFDKKQIAEESQPVKDVVFSEHFYVPMKYENERKLEYSISITYESAKFQEARMALLDTVSKYGFISNTRTYIQIYPYLIANFKIKTENLYQALKEFERIGTLTSETIQAYDQTEQIIITNRKYDREQERAKRKQNAIENKEKTYTDWDAKENDLVQHEIAIDDLEMQQWRQEDKLAWATVHIEIKGPAVPVKAPPVEMPQFGNAFTHLLKTFLYLAYAIVWALPYLIIVVILIILWKKIRPHA